MVADQENARRLRAILIREDLIPPQTDPFSIFEVDRFSITDFERNVNLQRALTRNLEQHITALDDVVAANVTLVVPETELFAEDQNPTTASIIITPRLGLPHPRGSHESRRHPAPGAVCRGRPACGKHRDPGSPRGPGE